MKRLLLLPILSFTLQSCVVKEFADNTNAKQTGPETELDRIPNELLVMFRDGTDESKIAAINDSLDVQVIRQLLNGRVFLIKTPKSKSVDEVRRSYLSFLEVESVSLNYKVLPLNKAR